MHLFLNIAYLVWIASANVYVFFALFLHDIFVSYILYFVTCKGFVYLHMRLVDAILFMYYPLYYLHEANTNKGFTRHNNSLVIHFFQFVYAFWQSCSHTLLHLPCNLFSHSNSLKLYTSSCFNRTFDNLNAMLFDVWIQQL